jgi:DNA repair exonuclease SbcCD ATPase subunit
MTTSDNRTFFPWPSTVTGGWHAQGNAVTDLVDAQVMRLQHLTEELQKAYTETYDRQVETLSQTSEKLTHSVQELLSSQGAVDMVSAESRLANAWFEGVAARSQNWLALGQKLQQCYAEFARASFEDLRKQSEDVVTEAGEIASDAINEASKQLKAVKTGTKHAA